MLETNRPGAKLTLDFEGTAVGIFCASGPAAGILEYSVDGAPFKKLDTFTAWSGGLYILGCICSIRSYRWENIA